MKAAALSFIRHRFSSERARRRMERILRDGPKNASGHTGGDAIVGDILNHHGVSAQDHVAADLHLADNSDARPDEDIVAHGRDAGTETAAQGYVLADEDIATNPATGMNHNANAAIGEP